MNGKTFFNLKRVIYKQTLLAQIVNITAGVRKKMRKRGRGGERESEKENEKEREGDNEKNRK